MTSIVFYLGWKLKLYKYANKEVQWRWLERTVFSMLKACFFSLSCERASREIRSQNVMSNTCRATLEFLNLWITWNHLEYYYTRKQANAQSCVILKFWERIFLKQILCDKMRAWMLRGSKHLTVFLATSALHRKLGFCLRAETRFQVQTKTAA